MPKIPRLELHSGRDMGAVLGTKPIYPYATVGGRWWHPRHSTREQWTRLRPGAEAARDSAEGG